MHHCEQKIHISYIINFLMQYIILVVKEAFKFIILEFLLLKLKFNSIFRINRKIFQRAYKLVL